MFSNYKFCHFQYAQIRILLKTLAFSFGVNQFFVCFSELLYPEGSISPNSGIAADILCKGRDYLVRPTLLYFQNNTKSIYWVLFTRCLCHKLWTAKSKLDSILLTLYFGGEIYRNWQTFLVVKMNGIWKHSWCQLGSKVLRILVCL